ncbi:ferrous iron transport protein B [uncultured Microscilla sp.]|uniref:ferrous iron transport protein B n=1 Tax=uncultured Microscilla sp. TaxID=432653 RepID=UPI0026160003|nr:ferrous iron transport protein B [uncultured Microscilla sp.]
MAIKIDNIALVGNPNSGKSTVFNQLTGLNQHVGNYPGVTVDKKEGICKLTKHTKIKVTDLPGTYSLYPRSKDEAVVKDLLQNPQHPDYPDLIVVVADSSNLERNLLLFTQIYDLKVPTILALNMTDLSEKKGIQINYEKLSEMFGNLPVLPMNGRKGEGIQALKDAIAGYQAPEKHYPFVETQALATANDATPEVPPTVFTNATESGFSTATQDQTEETRQRFEKIRQMLRFVIDKKTTTKTAAKFTQKTDQVVTHPIAGYVLFLGILLIIFQAIYALAEIPMNLIDQVFLSLSQWTKSVLPSGSFTNLIAEGVIPGIGGVVIFVPQIVLLFTFIVILEETGYMARIVFIMDRLMRPFGLSGKSVVPMISSVACAIPAVMATRTIDNWKDRMITILVTPLMSCSARLPVYTLLIALVVPDKLLWGVFNLKGLVLLGLYVLGLVMALTVAFIMRIIIKTNSRSFLVLELPSYKLPRWRNITITLWEKTRLFVWEAGKIILAISIILWVLASYGPGNRIASAVEAIDKPATTDKKMLDSYEKKVSAAKLENSYIGIMGKTIEPVISPLGYDWKIGIALITSFAAREVFVGSMATIYSVGADFESDKSLIDRLRAEKHANGKPVYSLATGLSLMVFYAFAMQCLSTLAIVRRETKSWKWPLIQLVYMTGLAYISALLVYQLF